MSLDLTARRVVMSSMLYYGLDAPTMFTDGDFDKACLLLATDWDQLDPIRQWQLGSAEEIRSTGNHCKVTVMAAEAAASWLETQGAFPQPLRMRPWRTPKGKPRYLQANEFRFAAC